MLDDNRVRIDNVAQNRPKKVDLGKKSGASGTAGSSGPKAGPAGPKSGAAGPKSGAAGPKVGSGPTARNRQQTSSKARQSVAAARQSKSGSNRTQLIIGAVAVALIIAVVVIGLVLNRKATAVQGDGYGASKSSTATVASGIITFNTGAPPVIIDTYEDAICPICADFEKQFGQQIARSVDEGKLGVRLHMLNFLNAGSASKDYSTRAYAALLAVATDAGSTPGLALNFHSALFDPANQPKEGGSADLTNQQLADLAGKSGAPATATADIAAGKYVAAAASAATASASTLQAATGRVATPTILKNNSPVTTNSSSWLTDLLAG